MSARTMLSFSSRPCPSRSSWMPWSADSSRSSRIEPGRVEAGDLAAELAADRAAGAGDEHDALGELARDGALVQRDRVAPEEVGEVDVTDVAGRQPPADDLAERRDDERVQPGRLGRGAELAQGLRRGARDGDDDVLGTGRPGDRGEVRTRAADPQALEPGAPLGAVVVEQRHGAVGRGLVVHEVADEQPRRGPGAEHDDRGRALPACSAPLLVGAEQEPGRQLHGVRDEPGDERDGARDEDGGRRARQLEGHGGAEQRECHDPGRHREAAHLLEGASPDVPRVRADDQPEREVAHAGPDGGEEGVGDEGEVDLVLEPHPRGGDDGHEPDGAVDDTPPDHRGQSAQGRRAVHWGPFRGSTTSGSLHPTLLAPLRPPAGENTHIAPAGAGGREDSPWPCRHGHGTTGPERRAGANVVKRVGL